MFTKKESDNGPKHARTVFNDIEKGSETENKKIYDKNWFDENGNHKVTRTKYDENWYDKNWIDKHWYDKRWLRDYVHTWDLEYGADDGIYREIQTRRAEADPNKADSLNLKNNDDSHLSENAKLIRRLKKNNTK